MSVTDITLITSIYNGEEFLEAAIESVLRQDYPHFHWIIIDDESNETTQKLLEKYAKQDKRITLIRRKNQGLTKNLNLALDKVTTPYVARMDGDDICLPARLRIQREYMESHPEVLLCGSWTRLINEKGETIKDATPSLTQANFQRKLFQSNPLVHSTWFARTETLKSLGGYDTNCRMAQDYDLALRLIEQGPVVIIPQVLLEYRVNAGSLSQKKMRTSLRYALRLRLKALRRGKLPLWYYILLLKPALSLLIPTSLKKLVWRTTDRPRLTTSASKTLRIISPQLGISPFSNSGGEVYDRETLSRYAAEGAEVGLILPRGKPYDQTIFKGPVRRVLLKHIVPPYLFNFLLLPQLFALYRKWPAPIIRIHSPYFSGLGILFFRLFHPEVKLIVSYFHVEKFPLFRAIDRFVLPKADHIFTISQASKNDLLESYSLPEEKITVTYCGIDEKYQPEPKNKDWLKKHNLEGKQVLLSLGGLKPRKNLPFLLEVFKELDRSDTLLVLAGSGSESAALFQQATELGIIDRVRFTGYVEEKDKVTIYNLGDIFVFPTALEGFGMVAAEAMACGLPVVASDIAPLREVVEPEKTGLLCPFNDKQAWKAALNRLLDDPALQEKMAHTGPEYVQRKFRWPVLAQTQIHIMQDIIQSKS